MAKLSDKSIQFPDFESGENFMVHHKRQTDVLDSMQKTSDAIDHTNPKADLTGALLRWQIADGYSFYVVTKNSPLTLAHVPYSDAWRVQPETIRGVNRSTVLSQLERRASYSKLFGKK